LQQSRIDFQLFRGDLRVDLTVEDVGEAAADGNLMPGYFSANPFSLSSQGAVGPPTSNDSAPSVLALA
jgi:hypothetical protein